MSFILADNNINVVGDWIYYSNVSGRNKGYFRSSLYKIRTDGSDRTKLTDDSSSMINVVGDWIYYCRDIKSDDNLGVIRDIYKIRTNGSDRTMLYEHENNLIMFINFVDDWLYCGIGTTNSFTNFDIYKMRMDGSGMAIVK